MTDELIARLQHAPGPDRELDARIECVRNGAEFVRYERWNDLAGRLHYKSSASALVFETDSFPAFTRSFDHARMLVPDGMYWHAGEGRTRADEPLGAAGIIAPGTLDSIAEAEHATVEIAFCIAALKSRALLAQRDDGARA